MHTYIIFLRAVNVSGNNIVSMKTFKGILEEEGFSSVKTYIQSGNIKLSSNLAKETILKQIHHILVVYFNVIAQLFIYTTAELKEILYKLPFDTNLPGNKVFITFTNQHLDARNIKLLLAYNAELDQLSFYKNIIFTYLESGMGTSKITNSLIEQKLKTIATGRNRNTIEKLLAL